MCLLFRKDANTSTSDNWPVADYKAREATFFICINLCSKCQSWLPCSKPTRKSGMECRSSLRSLLSGYFPRISESQPQLAGSPWVNENQDDICTWKRSLQWGLWVLCSKSYFRFYCRSPFIGWNSLLFANSKKVNGQSCFFFKIVDLFHTKFKKEDYFVDNLHGMSIGLSGCYRWEMRTCQVGKKQNQKKF